VLLVALSALFLAVGAPPASAATLVVDKDRIQCPDAQFSSIGAAVQAASPGGIVVVCPDLYQEAVTVDKPLTLLGPGVNGDPATMSYCSQPSRPDPTTEAIVQGAPIAIHLVANDVVLDGFVVQSPRFVTADAGVATESLGAFSGYQIRNNVIQNTSNNVTLATSGAGETAVRSNCLRFNRLAAVGSPPLNGVLFRGSNNARIADNAFYRNFGAAVEIRQTTADDVVVTNNDSLLNGRFVTARRMVGGRIVDNHASTSLQPSIEVGFGNVGLFIGSNDFEETGFGINITETRNSLLTIADNLIRDMSVSGIVAQPDTLVDSTVQGNVIRNSGQNGIEFHTGDVNNLIRENAALGSGTFDCYDDTVGSGTAGTANFWINDIGQTANRPGICD
jgi:Right handed beta helix region